MEHIWCNIAHHHLGIRHENSEDILLSKNRWTDFYNNPKYEEQRCSNQMLFEFIFRMVPTNNIVTKASSKMLLWYEIYKNPFLTNKEGILTAFSKMQGRYHTLLRFVDKVQKKYAKVKVSCDLNLENIELREGHTIVLFQDQCQYYFTLRDVVKICNSALSYSDHLFPDAYVPKNPYTNQPFSYKALLQIYFAIRRSDYKMPLLLEMFYSTNFSIKRFVAKYEYFIREEIIKNFIRNGTQEDFYYYIHEMLEISIFERKCKVCSDFPRDVLVKAMKKYVFLYLISEYSLRSTDRQFQYFNILKSSLFAFFDKNPTFGRRLMRRIQKVNETTGKMYLARESYFETNYVETNIVPVVSMRKLIHNVIIDNDINGDMDEED